MAKTIVKKIKPIERKFEYNGKLIRVLDGDTVFVELDLGFHIYSQMTVRLSGLDCPEKKTPEGQTVKAKTEKWFEGKRVTITSISIEKYGRLLGIITDQFGMTLNDFLIENGFGKPYKGDKKVSFTKEQIELILKSK